MSASTLVRFRADPPKVRVRLYRRTTTGKGRRNCCAALFVVGSATRFQTYKYVAPTFAEAVDRGLLFLEKRGVPGIDPGCEWAYPHPWGAEAAARANAAKHPTWCPCCGCMAGCACDREEP